jgi:transcription antitermination factor NusG
MLTEGDEGAQQTGWHALYTRHQHEKVVSEHLAGKGAETFLPLQTSVHAWKDRRKTVFLPLFPCYVFVRSGIDNWVRVVSTPGVHHIVIFGNQPAIIPESEIASIRRVIDNALPIEPFPYLKVGDWARVKAGPLEGLEGILVRKKNIFRLVLSIDMLGKSAAVEIDGSIVEPISHPGLRSSGRLKREGRKQEQSLPRTPRVKGRGLR